MSTLVTFMIVFFVGYCYDRHYQQCTPAARVRVRARIRARARVKDSVRVRVRVKVVLTTYCRPRGNQGG